MLLVNPQENQYGGNAVGDNNSLSLPMGIGCLADYLGKNNHSKKYTMKKLRKLQN